VPDSGGEGPSQRKEAQATDEDVQFVDDYDDDEVEVNNKFRNVVVEGPGSRIVHEVSSLSQGCCYIHHNAL
jgi:hypothetical protein